MYCVLTKLPELFFTRYDDRLLPATSSAIASYTMVRTLRVAAAQVGRVDRGTPKSEIVARLVKLLEDAASKDVKLLVFPETTFSG